MTRRSSSTTTGRIADNTPWVAVAPEGRGRPVEFVVDTGFNSFLSASHADLRAAGWRLLRVGRTREKVGDGREHEGVAYATKIRWLGTVRDVMVSDAGADDPVLGFNLLRAPRSLLRTIRSRLKRSLSRSPSHETPWTTPPTRTPPWSSRRASRSARASTPSAPGSTRNLTEP